MRLALVQVLERLGIGGVAGLGPLGARHAQGLEQHRLQLLGRAQVDGVVADGVVGVLLGGAHLVTELALERGEPLLVHADPVTLHLGEDPQQGQLHVREQRPLAGALQLGLEDLGEVDHGTGPHHGGLRLGVLVGGEVEHALRRAGAVHGELAVQVPQRQVGQVVGTLVGAHEVGRQGGVHVHPGHLGESSGPQGLQLALGLVQHQGGGRVGEPPSQGGLVVGREVLGGGVGPGAVRRGEGQTVDVTGPLAHRPTTTRPQRPVAACSASQPPSSPGARVAPSIAKPLSASGAADSTVANRRSRSTRNSRPSKTRCTSSRSQLARARSSIVIGSSTSRTSWLRRRLRRTWSRWVRRDSPALPLISCTCSTMPARSPYAVIHLAAVLGPTPGTPGRLSEVSPTRAARSL